MFCNKCGAELTERDKFCPKCGFKIGGETEKTSTPKESDNQSINKNSGKKFSPKLVIGALAAVLIVIVAIVAVIKLKKTTIRLNDYVSVRFEGLDGYGTAKLDFDTSKFYEDNKGKIKPDKKVKSLLKEDTDYKLEIAFGDYNFKNDKDLCSLLELLYASDYDFQTTGSDIHKLSNGDTVRLVWDLSTSEMTTEEAIELAKEAFNVRIIADDMEFTVEGLADVVTFDAFEGVEIEYSGTAPEAQANLKAYPRDNGLRYELDKRDKLKNGDKIIVSANYSYTEEEYAQQYGKLPEELSKEFVVEGVDEYVLNASQLSDDDLITMKKQTEDVIKNNVANTYASEYATIDSSEFDSAYLLIPKGSNGFGIKNKIVIMYKVTVNFSSEKGADESYTYYTSAAYNNIIRKTDGEIIVDISQWDEPWNSVTYDYVYIPSKSFWDQRSSTFYVNGYEKYDQLYNEVINQNSADYSSELISSAELSHEDTSESSSDSAE